jgi:hypothetical protein
MPNALQGISAPLAPTSSSSSGMAGLNGFVNLLNSLTSNPTLTAPFNDMINSAATAGAFIPSTLLPNMIGYFAGPGFNALGGGAASSGLGALLAPGGPLSALGGLGGGLGGAGGAASSAAGSVSATAPAVSASMGQASLVGSFSAPPSWVAGTPAHTGGAALQASGWAAAPEGNSVTAMPGGMPTGGAGRAASDSVLPVTVSSRS